MNSDDLSELMSRQEEPDPDLEPWLDDGPMGGKSLRHPLVYSVFHAPQMNALVNAQLKYKRAAVIEARKKRDFDRYVWLHERPWRIDAFCRIAASMSDSAYWKLLGSVYTDAENMWQNVDEWTECLTADRPNRNAMMSEDELEALKEDNSPEFTVFRGFHEPGSVEGFSWTTNSIVAGFFARRLAPTGAQRFVATGRVKREDVIAYFEGRSEYEMVVLPGKVRGVKIEEIEGDDG